jgi:hypothetical protein
MIIIVLHPFALLLQGRALASRTAVVAGQIPTSAMQM